MKTIELQDIKVKDCNPNRVIAWIDKDGQSRTISDPKYKIKKVVKNKSKK